MSPGEPVRADGAPPAVSASPRRASRGSFKTGRHPLNSLGRMPAPRFLQLKATAYGGVRWTIYKSLGTPPPRPVPWEPCLGDHPVAQPPRKALEKDPSVHRPSAGSGRRKTGGPRCSRAHCRGWEGLASHSPLVGLDGTLRPWGSLLLGTAVRGWAQPCSLLWALKWEQSLRKAFKSRVQGHLGGSVGQASDPWFQLRS